MLLFSGLHGGEENGRRGYQMTFSIAYIRVSNDIIMTSLISVTICMHLAGSGV